MDRKLIWIASYPKSGNTWIRLVLRQLQSGDGHPPSPSAEIPLASSRRIIDAVLGLPTRHLSLQDQDALRPVAYRTLSGTSRTPVLFKTHDAFDRLETGDWLFPPEMTWGAIYLVRNPLDVAVSWSFHADISLDEAVAFLCDEQALIADPRVKAMPMMRQMLHSWSSHAQSWLAAPVSKLVARYEDLVAEPLAQFDAITRFLGWQIPPEGLRRAVQSCQFDRLKRLEIASGFGERVSARSPFFRVGQPGDWRNHLRPEHVRNIIDRHGDMMCSLGYELPAGY